MPVSAAEAATWEPPVRSGNVWLTALLTCCSVLKPTNRLPTGPVGSPAMMMSSAVAAPVAGVLPVLVTLVRTPGAAGAAAVMVRSTVLLSLTAPKLKSSELSVTVKVPSLVRVPALMMLAIELAVKLKLGSATLTSILALLGNVAVPLTTSLP